MKKHLTLICTCVLSFSLLTGCSNTDSTEADTPSTASTSDTSFGENDMDGAAISALLLKGENETWLFVDTASQMPFTATIPEDITDADGSVLTADQLQPGNVIDIYGNNIMLQSYPAQYPGVTKMVVTDTGDASDVTPYQDMIDTFFVEPDMSNPPQLSISYTTELAAVSAVLSGPCNYTWSTELENGQNEEVIACGAHILQWAELAEMTIEASTDVMLVSDVLPHSIKAARWPSDAYAPESTEAITDEAGEEVSVNTDSNGDFIFTTEPGYVYQITATWEYGTAEYGFITK